MSSTTPLSGRGISRLDLASFVCRDLGLQVLCFSEELQVCVTLVGWPKPVTVLAVRLNDVGRDECDSFEIFREIKRD